MMLSSSTKPLSYGGIFEDKEMELRMQQRIEKVVAWRERPIPDTIFEGKIMEERERPIPDTIYEGKEMEERERPIPDRIFEGKEMEERERPIPDTTATKSISSTPHPISFATATASVRGNLGPVSVIISPIVSDWLRDRWQAAKDMSGAPILGPHFVLLTAGNAFTSISKVIIDWETASASNIRISAILYDGSSTVIYKFGDKRERSKRPKHVIDSIPIDFMVPITNPIEQIRIDINAPETAWGSSIWHVDVWGN